MQVFCFESRGNDAGVFSYKGKQDNEPFKTGRAPITYGIFVDRCVLVFQRDGHLCEPT